MKNAIFENRRNMTPEQSIKTLYEYARRGDASQRLYGARLAKGHLAFIGLLGAPIVCYVGYGMLFGVWATLSPGNQVTNLARLVNTQARQVYRPEIYLKDQYAKDILKKEENPLNLWH